MKATRITRNSTNVRTVICRGGFCWSSADDGEAALVVAAAGRRAVLGRAPGRALALGREPAVGGRGAPRPCARALSDRLRGPRPFVRSEERRVGRRMRLVLE